MAYNPSLACIRNFHSQASFFLKYVSLCDINMSKQKSKRWRAEGWSPGSGQPHVASFVTFLYDCDYFFILFYLSSLIFSILFLCFILIIISS